MSLSSTLRKNKNTTAAPLSNVRIHRSKTQTVIPMMKQSVVPAGTYTSRITAVTASKIENTQADAVDVIYELTADDGKVVLGRIRYELGGYHFDRLADALIDAGLPEGSSIVDAVGIEEELEISYPHQGSLAKIKSRRPLAASAVPQQKAAGFHLQADVTDGIFQCEKILAQIVEDGDGLVALPDGKLADVADAACAAGGQFAVIEKALRFPDQVHQGGFAGAVAADEGAVAVFFQVEGNILKQGCAAESKGQLLGIDHRVSLGS